MCGRYVLAATEAIAQRFNVTNAPANLAPHYNVAPTQSMPVVIKQSPNQLVLMRWGLIPAWAKSGKTDYSMINARAETLAQKPTFRKLLSFQRCLVPANGFYEWKAGTNGKTPYYIHLKDESLFAFAGLYDRWKDDQGNELLTYTIITTTPNPLMAGIHDRMPVILPKDAEEAWLNPDETEPAHLTPLLRPYPAEGMVAAPVSRAVNNVRNDSPDLLKPLAAQ